MSDPIKNVADSIKKLDRHIKGASSIQAVDLLTKREIDELRMLIQSGDNAYRYATERMGNPDVLGMYDQLSDSGFISCVKLIDGSIEFMGVNQKAHWAVARFDGKEAEYLRKRQDEERERKRANRRQWAFMLGGWVLGLASDPVKSLLYLICDQIEALF